MQSRDFRTLLRNTIREGLKRYGLLEFLKRWGMTDSELAVIIELDDESTEQPEAQPEAQK